MYTLNDVHSLLPEQETHHSFHPQKALRAFLEPTSRPLPFPSPLPALTPIINTSAHPFSRTTHPSLTLILITGVD